MHHPLRLFAAMCDASQALTRDIASFYDETAKFHSVKNEFVRVHRLADVSLLEKMVRCRPCDAAGPQLTAACCLPVVHPLGRGALLGCCVQEARRGTHGDVGQSVCVVGGEPGAHTRR